MNLHPPAVGSVAYKQSSQSRSSTFNSVVCASTRCDDGCGRQPPCLCAHDEEGLDSTSTSAFTTPALTPSTYQTTIIHHPPPAGLPAYIMRTSSTCGNGTQTQSHRLTHPQTTSHTKPPTGSAQPLFTSLSRWARCAAGSRHQHGCSALEGCTAAVM